MAIPAPWISQLTRTFVRKNNLTPSDLDVTDIRNPKYVSQSDPTTGDKNMKATFLFESSGGNYQGSELFKYKTVNLEKLFLNNSIPVVWGYNPHTTKDIAKLLIDQYGLSMHEDWFEEEPVDGSLLPTHFTIKTKSTDWCSASQLTVRVEQSEKDVAELFAVDVLDAPMYITERTYLGKSTKTCIFSTYGKDFTPRYTEEIEDIHKFKWTVGRDTLVYNIPANYPGFISLIEDIIGNDAKLVYSGMEIGEIYLGNLAVVYNGPTRGVHTDGEPLSKYATCDNISADTSYDNVLIARAYADNSIGEDLYSSPMFIHYNNV